MICTIHNNTCNALGGESSVSIFLGSFRAKLWSGTDYRRTYEGRMQAFWEILEGMNK